MSEKIINFYKNALLDVDFDLAKIDEKNFYLYNFDDNVKKFLDWSKNLLLKFDSIKTDFEDFVKQNEATECVKNFNIRSFMICGSAFADRSICYNTIIKKVILGVTERIFYYKDELIQSISDYPIFHFKLQGSKRIYLNNMFLDWYSVIDKLLFNIWAIFKNKEIYIRNLGKVSRGQTVGILPNALLNQEPLINSPLFLSNTQRKELREYQETASKKEEFKNLSLFNGTNFWTNLRNNFIHNEITYNQMFNETQLGHNVSFFDTIFIYYTCRLIYGSIELINACQKTIEKLFS